MGNYPSTFRDAGRWRMKRQQEKFKSSSHGYPKINLLYTMMQQATTAPAQGSSPISSRT